MRKIIVTYVRKIIVTYVPSEDTLNYGYTNCLSNGKVVKGYQIAPF